MKAEWRLTKTGGGTFAECRYTGEEWNGWFFPVSLVPREHYKWNVQLGLYVRNTSID